MQFFFYILKNIEILKFGNSEIILCIMLHAISIQYTENNIIYFIRNNTN